MWLLRRLKKLGHLVQRDHDAARRRAVRRDPALAHRLADCVVALVAAPPRELRLWNTFTHTSSPSLCRFALIPPVHNDNRRSLALSSTCESPWNRLSVS